MRIFFLTPRFPFPPHKGDSLRVYHQLRTLSRHHRITLLSMTDAPVAPEHLAEVQKLCESVQVIRLARTQVLLNLGVGMLRPEPLQVSYYQSPAFQHALDTLLAAGHFDAVHVTLMRMLPYVAKIDPKTGPRVVVDLIDSLTLNLEGRRAQVKGLKRWAYELEYRRVRDYEQNVVARRPNLVVSSPADQQLFGGEAVKVIPNGVDVDLFPFVGTASRRPRTLVFTGNMGYQPNEEAVLWFAAEVFPTLRAQYPGLAFQVVGIHPGERVKALARDLAGVEVTGAVPEVLPYLQQATVAVTPMRSGSGIQNKVLEAMSAGAPVVSTAIANRGVGGVHRRDLLIADTAEAFAAAVRELLETAELRSRLAAAGREWVEQHFRWERHAEQLAELYAGGRTVPDLKPAADCVMSESTHGAIA